MAYDKPKIIWCGDCQEGVWCLPEPGGETITGDKYITYTYRCPKCHHKLATEKIPLPKKPDANFD